MYTSAPISIVGLLFLLTCAEAEKLPSRTFVFSNSTTVSGLLPDQSVRVWLPVPPSNKDQDVMILAKEAPVACEISTESHFGNQILYAATNDCPNGTFAVSIVYRITRRQVKAGQSASSDTNIAEFLSADVMVPIDGKPLELIEGKVVPKDPLAAGRMLYDLVDDHMTYDKTCTGFGRGDAVWACEHGRGNCSDFHSLFIALARSQRIPAKFEIGFSIPEERGEGELQGYHCWAQFSPSGNSWVPVDISEADKNPKLRDFYFGNLTENRVMFSTGRDLNLVPRQNGPPLNFFIYPYVEVDGAAYPEEKVHRKFSYRDVERPTRK